MYAGCNSTCSKLLYTYFRFSLVPFFLPHLPPRSPSLVMHVLVMKKYSEIFKHTVWFNVSVPSHMLSFFQKYNSQVLFCLAYFFSPSKSLLKHWNSHHFPVTGPAMSLWHTRTAETYTCFHFWAILDHLRVLFTHVSSQTVSFLKVVCTFYSKYLSSVPRL